MDRLVEHKIEVIRSGAIKLEVFHKVNWCKCTNCFIFDPRNIGKNTKMVYIMLDLV